MRSNNSNIFNISPVVNSFAAGLAKTTPHSCRNQPMEPCSAPASVGGKVYACRFCDKHYTAAATMRRHERISHQSELGRVEGFHYRCDSCQRLFQSRLSLLTHQTRSSTCYRTPYQPPPFAMRQPQLLSSQSQQSSPM